MFPRRTGYLAQVCVLLHEALLDEEGNRVRGYYVVLGISTEATDPRALLSAAITDGSIDWSDTTWHRHEPENAGDDIKAFVEPDREIWYRSGRMFFV